MNDFEQRLEEKAREFWIKENKKWLSDDADEAFEFRVPPKKSHGFIHTRQVLPTDLTPDQVIEKVCGFLKIEGRQKFAEGNFMLGQEWALLIEANKERILK